VAAWKAGAVSEREWRCTRTDVDVMRAEAIELSEAIGAKLARLEPERYLTPLAARLRSLVVRLGELDAQRNESDAGGAQ
jgi:hypothetical protein